ncbi:MAG: polyketide synthase dehydratase domain-containing protein [Desulfobulbaceae bacterium]|nr:polyketide synthase dehydratase domain-containing protein [Desulfobulbaceae bacterium]
MSKQDIRETKTLLHGDVAIIGMAGVFPKAPDTKAFWRNILSKVDAIVDPPEESLISQVYDPTSDANDKIYCKRGGYLDELPLFYPSDYGIMPVAIEGAEPEHFIGLKIAQDALIDAGIPDKPLNRERTEVLIGRGTFVNRGYMTAMQHSITIDQTIRILGELHPHLTKLDLVEIRKKLKKQLPPFSPETAPGLCHNVMAGLIANRLDLKGRNLVLDAACASCLLAVEIAITDLLLHKCDAALVGAIQVSTHAPIHMIFTHLGALSRSPHLRPFGKDADGTMLGEGIGMMLLKRREDAVGDGHRIYALIKGAGSSSDGRGKGLLAPSVEGEELAMRRAYEAASIDPATVELIEAHGTGIPLGDVTEFQALRNIFPSRKEVTTRCGVGSVKSMIGHLIPAAGAAGLIKTAFAMYHKVLPPTIFCEEINPELGIDTSPFYINTETRPWIHGATAYPRRAGVSAFGFGGINAHVILEEYYDTDKKEKALSSQKWDSELFVFHGKSRSEVISQCREFLTLLPVASEKKWSLADLAFSLNKVFMDHPYRLAIIASSLEELSKKISYGVERLQDGNRNRIKDRSGIYFFETPLAKKGKLAFLFPGEGSQYVNMLADLCLFFPEARSCFDLLDRAYADHPRGYLPSHFIFPPTEQEKKKADQIIFSMEGAVDAVSTANRALFKIFTTLGIVPDAIIGHSSGELAALEASGAVLLTDEEEVLHHIQAGNAIIEHFKKSDTIPEGQLLAVGGVDMKIIDRVIQETSDFLRIAMENCPHQFVLCGTEQSVREAAKKLQKSGAICQPLPFRRAYHTERFEPALKALRKFFSNATFTTPPIPLYSCMTAGLYPDDPESIRNCAIDQWARQVQFRKTVEKMYDDGIRIFLELGPRANLTGFVNDTLKGKDVLAVSSNVHHRPAITQLQHTLALLLTNGVSMDLMAFYQNRQNTDLKLFHRDTKEGPPAKRGMKLSRELPMLSLKGENLDLSPAGDRDVLPTSAPPDTDQKNLQTETGEHHQIQLEQKEEEEMTDKVMLEYLKTMENFLKMQEKIMQTYLNQGGIVSGDMPVPPEMAQYIEPPPAAPIQPVEPVMPEANKVVNDSPPSPPSITPLLLSLVSEKTGYPEDMLDMNVNIEADLGIDSIKRVEILGALTKQLGVSDDFRSEKLTGLHTLAEIVSFLEEQQNSSAEHADGDAGLKKKSCDRLEVEISLDLKGHPYLYDHSLGGRVSQYDEELYGLPVMPFNMGLELMAQAAGQLFADKVLITIRKARAHSWLLLEQEKLTFRIVVHPQPTPFEARVSLYKIPSSSEEKEQLTLEAVMLFADTYPSPPPIKFVPKEGGDACLMTREEIYPKHMFHGPTFQSIAAFQQCGRHSAQAILEIPETNLFQPLQKAPFLTEPVLIDGAGQVVGLWAAYHLDERFVVFPAGMEKISFFGDATQNSSPFTCQAETRLQGDSTILSQMNLFSRDGTLFAEIKGLQHRRIIMPEIIHRFRGNRKVFLSSSWNLPIQQGSPSADSMTCCRLQNDLVDLSGSDRDVLLAVMAHIILSRNERHQWRGMNGTDKRRKEWLLGRLVGKEAIRRLLGKQGEDIWPADIEIVPDKYGKPEVQGKWLEEGCRPSLSLSHTGNTVVALAACLPPKGSVGIDIEKVHELNEEFMAFSFSANERKIVANDQEKALRCWCAKEAAAKAVGFGLPGGPQDMIVKTCDDQTGEVKLENSGLLAKKYGAQICKEVKAFTLMDGDIIVATAVIEGKKD